MDILRWRRKKEVTSRMDDRFGDPSISAPTQGSWNEMPPLRQPVKMDPFVVAHSHKNDDIKVGRFKALMRAQTVDGSPGYSVGTTTTTTNTTNDAERVNNFPRHPMVDMHNHQRSASMDRNQGRLEKQRNNSSSSSRPRLSSSPHEHRTSYDSCSGSDADDDRDEPDSVDRRDMARHYTANRSRSQEDHWRAQHRSPLPTPHRQHKSPPLSSTAMMRRYSSQSESTRTFASTSTPSTASFSSKHTSMTTPGLHGFSGSVVPPLLKEEDDHATVFDDEYIPPVPSLRNNRATTASASPSPPSASSHSASRGQSRGGRSKQRQYMVPVGPQELVPSNDELWGY